MTRTLSGLAALVTGASSGIGRSCALALANAGASVAVNHLPRSSEAADEVVDRIVAGGGRAVAVAADVSDEAEVAALFGRTVEAFGDLDVVVCNAGIQDDARFVDMTVEQWSRVLAVNLTGPFLCARAAARHFLARGPTPRSPALG